MTSGLGPALDHVRELTDAYRVTCLWFLREDYYPQTIEEALIVLDAIARHGDVAAFQRVAKAREWLSLLTSATSAD